MIACEHFQSIQSNHMHIVRHLQCTRYWRHAEERAVKKRETVLSLVKLKSFA